MGDHRDRLGGGWDHREVFTGQFLKSCARVRLLDSRRVHWIMTSEVDGYIVYWNDATAQETDDG